MHYFAPRTMMEQRESSARSPGPLRAASPSKACIVCPPLHPFFLFLYVDSPEVETGPGALRYRVPSVRLRAHHQGDGRERGLRGLLQVSPLPRRHCPRGLEETPWLCGRDRSGGEASKCVRRRPRKGHYHPFCCWLEQVLTGVSLGVSSLPRNVP